jgi:hypothetical protein
LPPRTSRRRHYDDDHDDRDNRDGEYSSRRRSRREREREEQEEAEYEMELQEKQELVRELDKMRSLGATLTLNPSVDMPLWKLRHEHERHSTTTTIVQRVKHIKMGLSVVVYVVEMVAVRFFKRLNGWAKTVTADLESGSYDAALEEIYRSMWGRGPPNPWIQLGFMIVGSAVMFMIRPEDAIVDTSGNAVAAPAGGSSLGGGGGLSSLFSGFMGMLGGGGNKRNSSSSSSAPPPSTTTTQPRGGPAAAAASQAPRRPSTPAAPAAVPVANVTLPPLASEPPRRRSRLAPPAK